MKKLFIYTRVCINKDFVHSGSIGLIQGRHASYVMKLFVTNCSCCHLPAISLLMEACVRSCLLYGIQAWYIVNEENIRKLEICWMVLLRQMVNGGWSRLPTQLSWKYRFFCVIQLGNMYISEFAQHRVAEIRGWLNTCVTETGLLLVCFVVILT